MSGEGGVEEGGMLKWFFDVDWIVEEYFFVVCVEVVVCGF